MLKVKLKSRKRYNTGPGAGLGLSLAYDIIKVHGGELKVQTKEGGRFSVYHSIARLNGNDYT